ncbi:MAG TPA: hypothetical protein VGM81_22530 [Burkholderiaceae bacterium]|jgi:hypothetical protein
MKKETRNLTSLQAVIVDAYTVFGRHRAPAHPLDACTACCLSEELEQEMRQLPLNKLSGRHFYEYNTAAKSDTQPADEVLYLLPRMLELIAEGVDVHHSIELALQRVGSCPSGSFGQKELDVLDRFALAYFQEALCAECVMAGRCKWHEEPMSILLMFHMAGLSIEPLLDGWLRTSHPAATVQWVEATYWRFWEKQEYENPFADDYPVFKRQIKHWLLNPEHRQRFIEKLMAPEFQQLAELQRPTGHTTFSTMVDAVFDQLTQ